MKRTRLHLTAFGPFLDVIDNPSARIAKELIPLLPAGVELASFCELEVSIRGVDNYFAKEKLLVEQEQKETRTSDDNSNALVQHLFLHLGVHRGARGEIRLEVRGRNEAHFPAGDMVGQVKDHSPIDESKAIDSYLESQIDQQFLADVARVAAEEEQAQSAEQGDRLKCNVAVTFDAGAYLCNYCLYRSVQNTTLMNGVTCGEENPSSRRNCTSLFIHVLDPDRCGEGPDGIERLNPTISHQAVVIARVLDLIMRQL